MKWFKIFVERRSIVDEKIGFCEGPE